MKYKSYLNSFLLLDFTAGKILFGNILEEMIMINHYYKLLDYCWKRLSFNLHPIILLWSDQKTSRMAMGWMMNGERYRCFLSMLFLCYKSFVKEDNSLTIVQLSATYLLEKTWSLNQKSNHNVNVGLPWQNFSPRPAKVNLLQTVLILIWSQVQLVQL